MFLELYSLVIGSSSLFLDSSLVDSHCPVVNVRNNFLLYLPFSDSDSLVLIFLMNRLKYNSLLGLCGFDSFIGSSLIRLNHFHLLSDVIGVVLDSYYWLLDNNNMSLVSGICHVSGWHYYTNFLNHSAIG